MKVNLFFKELTWQEILRMIKRLRKNGKFIEVPKVIVQCSVCKKYIERTENNIKGKQRFYCSCKCQCKRGTLKTLEKTCPECKKKFKTFKSHNQVFCSKQCYINYGRLVYTCVYCGKQRVDIKCYSKMNKKWYCNRKCFAKARRNKIIAPYKNLSRTGQWKSWRKRVLKRDNFKCVECGSKNDLEGHHIKSVKWCIENNKINLIFDISNGLTLCQECHKMTESWGIR